MATCSVFANPLIDTEEGTIALADAFDRFTEEQGKRPHAPRQRNIDPKARNAFAKVLERVREAD